MRVEKTGLDRGAQHVKTSVQSRAPSDLIKTDQLAAPVPGLISVAVYDDMRIQWDIFQCLISALLHSLKGRAKNGSDKKHL